MRRTLLAAVAAATLASPALAAPASVTVNDPTGDWVVASQDIKTLRLTTDGKSVKVAFDLMAAPDPAARYDAYFATADCAQSWELTATAVGTSAARAQLLHVGCDTAASLVQATPVPATVTVRASTVELSVPYALGIKRGQRVTYFNGSAAPTPVIVFAGMDPGDGALTGDLVLGEVRYAIR